MKTDPQNVANDFERHVEELLLPFFSSHIEAEYQWYNKFLKEVLRETKDQKENHHANILSLLRNYQKERSIPATLEERYLNFFDNLKIIEIGLPLKLIKEQSEKRFQIAPEEKNTLRLKKSFKIFSFSIFKSLNNLFKSDRATNYWNHKINLRNAFIRCISIESIKAISDLESKINKNFCETIVTLKNYQEGKKADLEAKESKHTYLSKYLENNLSSCNAEMQETIQGFTNVCTDGFLEAFEKMGTIELSGIEFSDEKINTLKRKSINEWSTLYIGWNHTKSALLNEWISDIEVLNLKASIDLRFVDFLSVEPIQYLKDVKEISNKLESLFLELKEEISDLNHPSYISLVKKANYQVQKKLNMELIPDLTKLLTNHEVSKFVDQLEVFIIHQIERLSPSFEIIKTFKYNQPVSKNSLSIISPYELINFEILPALQTEIDKVQQNLFVDFENSIKEAMNINSIVSYSLATGIRSLEDQGEKPANVLTSMTEGLERANVVLSDVLVNLEESISNEVKSITVTAHEFSQKLHELANADNVRILNLRLKKARASHKAISFRKRISQNIVKTRNKVVNKSKAYYRWFGFKWKSLKQKFVLTADAPSITKEIEEFLSESKNVINNLPIIYKRLYHIEPIKDLSLFVGREKEAELLVKSFEDWNNGKPNASIIIGEKWVGKTSFINYSLNSINTKCPIIKYTVVDNISSEDQLLESFKNIFKDIHFTNFDELIETLNDGNQRIIVFEDIQNIFLRKMNGFDSLKTLYILINRTQKNIFWVISITKYAWNYLNKSANLFEFFGSQIEMGSLSNDQMKELVLRRNKITGYKLHFDDFQIKESRNKLKKKGKQEAQNTLRESFFHNLNDFSKGNISLALRFWLLSTQSFNESTINIRKVAKPDLSFITMISMDKVFILHALILHDGLTSKQVSEVINVAHTACKLSLISLAKNGIVNSESEVYELNPLLYRNVINLLKSKNLLH